MGNPLLLFWHFIFEPLDGDAEPSARSADRVGGPSGQLAQGGGPGVVPAAATSDARFLVLRRMRVPLLVLVLVFSISVLGLTLIPGQQPDGGTAPMTFFEALYFMTYTAATIGYGEIPYELTTPQRMWVTFAIYLAVIGWAYAIGSLLAMLQDKGFRREIGARRFARQVRHMSEPFWILAGYGEAGARVTAELDRRGHRLVVLDRAQERVDALDLAALRADVPALVGNARSLPPLQLAGLQHRRCAGVLALTDDDEANLAVVQAAHLLRPGLPVLARANVRTTVRRMRPFGDPTVVDPFDAFGDRLGLTLRTPALAQLFEWLVRPVGAPLPERLRPPVDGRWVVVGQGSNVAEVVADLTAAGLRVQRVSPTATTGEPGSPHAARTGDPAEGPEFAAMIADSAAVVAAAERDTLNLSYVAAARRANPDVFVVARQESPANADLFASLAPDLLLVPADVVAREVLERLANPALWDFLQLARPQGDQWAAELLDALVATSGTGSPTVWQVRIDADQAPALTRRLANTPVQLGELMLSPFGRTQRLPLTVLALQRGDRTHLLPDTDVPLALDDVLLVAGGRGAQRAWDATLGEDDLLSYVVSGQAVATSWWGRRLLRTSR